jgi:hypothetical protein
MEDRIGGCTGQIYSPINLPIPWFSVLENGVEVIS